MDWQDLTYLLAVHRSGSLSGAAARMHVDQTTVGRRLSALEKRLGVRLLDRRAEGCTLTEAGRLACGAAETMETATLGLDRDLAALSSGVTGVVRIATALGVVPMLTAALAALRRQHPALTFAIVAHAELHNLVRGEADIAIRMTPDSQPSLLARRVGSSPWALYASADYLSRRGVPASLDGHDVITYEGVLDRSPGARWLAEHSERANIVLTTHDPMVAVVAAAAGLGIAALPSLVAAHQPTLGRAMPEAIGESPMYLVTHANLAQVPRVRVTMDHLAAWIPRALRESP